MRKRGENLQTEKRKMMMEESVFVLLKNRDNFFLFVWLLFEQSRIFAYRKINYR